MITDHAYERLKERLGWNKKTSNRMVPKIWNEGKKLPNGSRVEIKHGNHSFLFYEEFLVTVYDDNQIGDAAEHRHGQKKFRHEQIAKRFKKNSKHRRIKQKKELYMKGG